MDGNIGNEQIKSRLRDLLAASNPRRAVVEAGTELLARIDAPVRTVLFGLPRSGKSRLLNQLLGDDVLPPDVPLPTLALRYGPDLKTEVVLADGTTRQFDGLPFEEIAAADPLIVEIEMPEDRLRALQLMEIGADADPGDQMAAMHWASPQTDIALWCSTGFGAGEAEIWARSPDAFKDNGYLVMTAPSGPAASTDDFVATFSVSDTTGAVGPLLAELLKCADRGQQAYADHALLFLSRYEDGETARTNAQRPEVVMQSVAKTPPDVIPIPVKAKPRALQTSENDAASVVRIMRQRARELSATLPATGDELDGAVVVHCMDTLDLAAERFGGDAGPSDLEDLVLDAADTLVLLGTETGEARATSSVKLLLQLCRDIESTIPMRQAGGADCPVTAT